MITVWIFALVVIIMILHTLIGVMTIPLQGALVIDATGHAVLLGITAGFLIVKNLHSPLLFIGAIVSAFIMHALSGLLSGKQLLAKDTALGVSFSFLFAIGILLITLYARNVHLDLDIILVGNIEYAIYDQFFFNGIACGPYMFWLGGALIILLSIGLFVFWRPLHVLFFDEEHARLKGYPMRLAKIALIFITSYAMVASFNVAGAIILAGITSAPLAMWWSHVRNYASLLFYSLFSMIVLGCMGTALALLCDLPIAATVACMVIMCTILHLVFLHKKSFVVALSARRKLRLMLIREIIIRLYGMHYSPSESEIASLGKLIGVSDVVIESALIFSK